MNKRNRGITALTLGILVTVPLFAFAATSYAQEFYDGTARDIWVKTPLDMWYIDEGGITEFPVFVKAQGYQEQGTWGWHYEPRELLIDVYVRDLTLEEGADWMELSDYDLHTSTLGTILTVEGHANVFGSFGDGETYEIGGEIGCSWSGQTSDWQHHSMSRDTYGYYWHHLGQVQVILVTGGVTQNNWGVTLKVGIPNSDAPDYDQHRYAIRVEAKMWFKAYWYSIGYADREYSYSNAFIMGNSNPSSDCSLYLLEAQDYDNSLGN
ncbi:MAG: hypothetical protein R6V83_07435 [Candidatus Thorarchaeota archaeon]